MKLGKKKIIFDTDIGGDCDDAGALALLHGLCEQGEAELLAVTGCYATPYLAGCIDAINTHYGRQVPVGILHDRFTPRDVTDGYNGYDKSVAEHFPNRFPDWRKVPDSVRVIREILAGEEDGAVTLAATGPLTTLARLVMSGADDLSPLTGRELIEKKIARTVVMGGRFFGTWPFEYGYGIETPHVTAEWNIYADIPAAQTVCGEWPGELVFTSHEIGNWTITLRGINDDENRKNVNPTAHSYFVHHGKGGRESWDLTAILYAVRPEAGYWNLHPWGRISVDEKGVTGFRREENGKHSYLMPRFDVDELVGIMDGIVESSLYYDRPSALAEAAERSGS
jgi:inosine-uridine nucleoside N-ribohydrolase